MTQDIRTERPGLKGHEKIIKLPSWKNNDICKEYLVLYFQNILVLMDNKDISSCSNHCI